MGDHKAPSPPPSQRPPSDPVSQQVKPKPPPAPPLPFSGSQPTLYGYQPTQSAPGSDPPQGGTGTVQPRMTLATPATVIPLRVSHDPPPAVNARASKEAVLEWARRNLDATQKLIERLERELAETS